MKKYEEIDFARCVLMAIVILVHVVNFGNLHPGFKQSMFTFFMPAFLIITGYLVNIEKDVKEFAKYLKRIALPYVIMVTSFSIMSLFLPVRDGLDSFSLSTIADRIFISSIGPYWFLYDMIVCGTVYYAIFHTLGKLSTVSRLALFAFVLYALALCLPLLTPADATLYFIGAALRQSGVDFRKAFPPTVFSLLPFVILIVQPELWHRWICLVLPFFAISFLSWCHGTVTGKVKVAMNYCGRNTLPIYIFHPVFTMLSKYYLPLFAFDGSGIIHAAVTIALGFCGSLLIAKTLDKTRLSRVFGVGKLLR